MTGRVSMRCLLQVLSCNDQVPLHGVRSRLLHFMPRTGQTGTEEVTARRRCEKSILSTGRSRGRNNVLPADERVIARRTARRRRLHERGSRIAGSSLLERLVPSRFDTARDRDHGGRYAVMQ
jgi:hypothetical protein